MEFVAANIFPKKRIGIPARIPPQTPPAGGKSAEAKRKILSPRKKDFRFAESVLKPHALSEYLEDRTPKEKHSFLFQKKFHPRQTRNARSVFSFGVAGVLASAWGFLRAYRAVSLHYARGACDISCFGNRCELGTIETPKLTCLEMTAPRGEYTALRRAKSAFVFAVKSQSSPQLIESVLSLISGLEPRARQKLRQSA